MQKEGFSDAIIDRFFKPFLGGIFFDKDLNVTSRLFEFVMRMLASGENSLPANGIGAISEQMAAALPAGTIKTGEDSSTITKDAYLGNSSICNSFISLDSRANDRSQS